MALQSNSKGLTETGVPVMPIWLTIIRGVIIALSLGALIAAAYNLSLFGGYGIYLSSYTGPSGFLIFDAIFTWLIVGGMLVAEFFAPQLYVRLAFIIALILCGIFWLSAWAWAASIASSFYSWYNDYNDYYTSDPTLSAYGASMAAGAALGAITWVLVIVFIVFFVRACLSCQDESQNQAELGEAKPPQNPQYPPQEPQYPPQNVQYPPQNPQYPPQNVQYPPQQPQPVA